MAIYGYARVSTRTQEDGFGLEVQRAKLREAGAERIFEDVFTGTTMDRPAWDGLDSLLADGDTLVVAKLDRIARTSSGGFDAVKALLARGVAVHILNMGLVDDTPTGKLILNIMFAFAEFERDMIVERLADGKAAARRRDGYREGRPRAEVDDAALAEQVRMVEAGETSRRAAARELGISEATFRRRMGEYHVA